MVTLEGDRKWNGPSVCCGPAGHLPSAFLSLQILVEGGGLEPIPPGHGLAGPAASRCDIPAIGLTVGDFGPFLWMGDNPGEPKAIFWLAANPEEILP